MADATATTGMPSLVEVDSLTRAFGGETVVGPVSFALPRGTRLALAGPNGSGKSTVLRCLAGTLTPTAGTVRIGGHVAGSLAARALLGVSLSQERSFDPRLSGHANLVFFTRLRGIAPRAAEGLVARIEEELELAEIARERVANCSTGMTQQLAFARTVLGDPSAIVLDEPTRSLDEPARARLWAALERRTDVAAVIASHREDDLARCDRRIDLAA